MEPRTGQFLAPSSFVLAGTCLAVLMIDAGVARVLMSARVWDRPKGEKSPVMWAVVCQKY